MATTLCLQHEARKIALAAMLRMAEQAKIELPLPAGRSFNEFFDITQAELDGEPG